MQEFFFQTGALLIENNTTLITLVPKCLQLGKMTDFRPISCCNIFYKGIAKILANRLKKCPPMIISKNQSAFIKGRRIIDNILLAREIVKEYGKAIGKLRCTLKIDIM